jgi:hypothetical protein
MPLGGLLTAGLIVGGAGLAAKTVGGVKAAGVAKKYDALGREVPEAQISQYVKPMIGTAQSALNANPLAQSLQRRTQTGFANILYQARNIGDQSQILGLLAGAGGRAEDAALAGDIANQQMQDQRRQAYYGALAQGIQADQQLFADKLTNIQSRASLAGAAAKSRAEPWNQLGGGLLDIGGGIVQAGGYK